MKKLLSLSIAAVLSVCALHADTKIVIKGSDTLGAKLVPQLAEAYKASHPGVSFSIAAEGSTTGIAAIIDGTADIGMASRRAFDTEFSSASANGRTLKPTIVAYDGIAVIVNSFESRRCVDQDPDRRNLLRSKSPIGARSAAKPGPISIYTRNTSSGTFSDFKKMAMSGKDYAGSAQKMAGNEEIASEVGKNSERHRLRRHGLPQRFRRQGCRGQRRQALDRHSPEPLVPDLSRSTFYYTNGTPTGEAASSSFTISPAGQKIVQQVGFAPLK